MNGPSVPSAEPRRRRDAALVGRGLIIGGVAWILLAGWFATFLLFWGDCFAADDICAAGRADAIAVANFLPWAGVVALLVAIAAVWFRTARYGLLVIGLLIVATPWMHVDQALVIPYFNAPIRLLSLPFLIQFPAGVLWIIAALLLLFAGRRAPQTTVIPGPSEIAG